MKDPRAHRFTGPPPAQRGGRGLHEIRITELSDGQFRDWVRIMIGKESLFETETVRSMTRKLSRPSRARRAA